MSECVKLKYICESYNGNLVASSLKEEGKTPVYGAGGLSGYTDKDGMPYEYLGIVKDGAGVGRICKYPKGSLLVGTLAYIIPKQGFNIDWIKYCITNLNLADSIDKTTIPHVYFSQYGNEMVPVLEIANQEKIADFLDKKINQIDELISNQEKQIEKLEEYKQSIITNTVTKGLDPNAKMKDSGVEWIGEIPEGWNVTATKSIFDVFAGATPDSGKPINFDGDIKWVTPADYKTNDVYVSKGRRNLSEIGFSSCSTTLVPKDSLIFSKRAPIGSIALAANEICTNQGCLSCVVKKNIKANPKFYYYFMSCMTEFYELFGSGTTFKEISAQKFASFMLAVPSYEEQNAIVEKLDKSCDSICSLIKIKENKIEKLQDYKRSLVYECVTGKRRIL